MNTNIRNIAIIAHVDHGKTTLVDALLKQTKVDRHIDEMGERIMDSMDLERERGITIKAKNASVVFDGVKINIVDTPGHADFGGEVERTLQMVDGVLLLVDAKEGPMPQTRFVLKKALQLGHKAIVVINKVDRPDARIQEVVNKTFDLFVELGANHDQLDFPIVYASGLRGYASLEPLVETRDLVSLQEDGMKPLFQTIIKHIPAPIVSADKPLQILVLALHYDSYKGKMGIGKIISGNASVKQPIVAIEHNGKHVPGKITDILVFEGLERISVASAQAGEIVAIAGLPDVHIGETIADAANPVQIPPVSIDEPTVQMNFLVNTSPFAGKEGKFVTSRNLRERLYKELETNVALRVEDTESPDTLMVAGRGEMHLGVLIETMRREGYEFQVSQPKVIYKDINGKKCEPFEYLVIDVPADFQGAVIEEIGSRKATMITMENTDHGEVHFEYSIPTRALIGLKNVLMTKTKGLAIMHHVFDEYKELAEGVNPNPHGSLIAFETGTSSSYGLENAQQRGELFIGPGVEIYAGQVIGQNSRDEDLEVNVCKAKKLTNMRSSSADMAIILTPPKEVTLDFALEYIGEDELLEVTPKSLRIRKRLLDSNDRKRVQRAEK